MTDPTAGTRPALELEVNGVPVSIPDTGVAVTLLDVLREQLGLRSVKDGCSPQGQCGCCTVLVDGQPRVACVTPARRVRGRSVTTLEGLPEEDRAAWGRAFCDAGASQCGFCTPGIVLRLEGLRRKGGTDVDQALLAHLCRCTGWQTIREAFVEVTGGAGSSPASSASSSSSVSERPGAAERAALEGRNPQRVGPEVALGEGGFADDTAPPDALVAVPHTDGGWAVAATLADARAASGKVQGRRTTVDVVPPLEVPDGDWDVTLRTSWVEPAYLETDASWCAPGGEPASPLANGGAFGGKRRSPAALAARRLADEHGRPVRVVLSREDAVRRGPKRPPIAAGVRRDGTGVVRVVRTPGIAEAITSVAPGLVVEEVDVPGPATSADLRAAGWAEALVLLAAVSSLGTSGPDVPGAAGAPGTTGDAAVPAEVELTSPDGAWARAEVVPGDDPRIRVTVRCGDPLDEVVLRSYCIGAAHMALGWVSSEGLAVDAAGEVHDLTIRSFGILRAVDMPPVEVVIEPDDGPPVNGSDAVFAAVAAATWRAQGLPPVWPTGRRLGL
ncbi:MAG TPA: 2Fe-2S iron-sulfur cluster-binding protein [Acidimicrobiales bacterium]